MACHFERGKFGLGGELQAPDTLQNPPEGRLWGSTHGSIRVQEGQPFFQRLNDQMLTALRLWVSRGYHPVRSRSERCLWAENQRQTATWQSAKGSLRAAIFVARCANAAVGLAFLDSDRLSRNRAPRANIVILLVTTPSDRAVPRSFYFALLIGRSLHCCLARACDGASRRAAEKRAALDAWAAHVLAAAEGRSPTGNVVRLGRAG